MIAVVTGAANGLGLELARVLHSHGYDVCGIDKDEKGVNKLAKEVKSNFVSFAGNVADEKFVIKSIKEISKRGKIDVLINCAGTPSFKLPTEYSQKDVDLCFEGLKGMIYASTHVLKHMEQTGGKIINILSSAALRGNKQESVYCAAKWAERGYTESLKVAYKDTNIRIFGVYPGGINTNFYKNSRDYVSKEKQATFMSAKELAEVIYDNLFTEKKLLVEDLVINRIK